MLGNHAHIASLALIDSGCTSSAINRAFAEKHNIPTCATAVPITVIMRMGQKIAQDKSLPSWSYAS